MFVCSFTIMDMIIVHTRFAITVPLALLEKWKLQVRFAHPYAHCACWQSDFRHCPARLCIASSSHTMCLLIPTPLYFYTFNTRALRWKGSGTATSGQHSPHRP